MRFVDPEVWFALGPLGWLLVGVSGAGIVVLGLAGLLVAGACVSAAFARDVPSRDRLVSLGLGVAAAAAVWWGGGGLGRQLVNQTFSADEDFAAVRIDGAELVLVPGLGDDVRRPAATLRRIDLDCVVEEVSGEEANRCRREITLVWADGSRSRRGDTVPAGWDDCPEAIAALEDDARAVQIGRAHV